ncbi:MAG: polysaccharide pyruvyl transferase family protein [Candidatus Thiodiazotropha sp.]
MKSVSIIAATISGNRGAEAMLTTTIGQIRSRYPECRFQVYSYYPEQDRQLISDPRIQVFSATPLALVTRLFPGALLYALAKLPLLGGLKRLLPACVGALDASDVLIDLAGVSFIDGREKFLPFNILTLAPAIILNTPVVKLSQALGPFRHRLNRLAARATLRFCRQVFARGEGTFEHMRELQLKCLFPAPVADVAFLHRPEYSLTDENPEVLEQLSQQLETESRPLIGLCPSSVLAAKSLKHDQGYIESLAALCEQLLDQGYAVLLFPNATRAASGERLRNNDLPVIQRIARMIRQNRDDSTALHSVDCDINTNGIKQLMAFCRVVMVSRFHAMIAALSACQPVIVLGWSHKYREVMERFELGDRVFDFKQAELSAILDAIRSMAGDPDAVKQQLARHHPAVLDSSRQQFEFLFDNLGPRG